MDKKNHVEYFDTQAEYDEAQHLYPNLSSVNGTIIFERTKPIKPLTFTAQQSNSTVKINKKYTTTETSFEYSLNNSDWTAYTFNDATGATITLVNIGDKVSFRNSSETTIQQFNTLSGYYQFAASGKVAASGSVMSLLKKNAMEDVIPDNYCFNSLFGGCASLTTAPELPATTLTKGCYESMFENCTSLTNASFDLPATTLANRCYRYMFRYCTSLTETPHLLAAELYSECCYEMFRGCTSLTTAPELPATTLPDYCYQAMFFQCTSLNQVKCLATDLTGYNRTDNWLSGVSSTGTFVKKTGVEWTTGASGIPEGWTVIEEAWS